LPGQAPALKIRRGSYWLGRGLSGIVITFFLFDAGMKLLMLPVVVQANAAWGFPGDEVICVLGIILLCCTILYAVPRTAFLGALLLTGYRGGAVAAHLRVLSPLFTHILFGVYCGLFVWGGLYLRDPRLRALLPFN
jgi:hypothetical protein